MSCHWWNCLSAIEGDVGQVVNKVTGAQNRPTPLGRNLPSTQPVQPPINVPNGGQVPPGVNDPAATNGGGCFGLPSWVCSAGKGIVGVAGGLVPKNGQGGVDWGKLAGYGAAGAGIYAGYEQGKNQQEYLNKLLGLTESHNARAQEAYASRAPLRSELNTLVQGKLAGQGKDIFTPYLHKGQGQG